MSEALQGLPPGYQVLLAPPSAEPDDEDAAGIGVILGTVCAFGGGLYLARRLMRRAERDTVSAGQARPFPGEEHRVHRVDVDHDRHRELVRVRIDRNVDGIFGLGPDGDELVELRADPAAFAQESDVREWAVSRGISFPEVK